MLKYAITLLFSVSLLNAQDNNAIQPEVNVGDVFEIGKPEANKYKHIDFPRENFIIKRGGLANYRRVHGEEVVVTAVKELKDGSTQIKIKRNDGGRFFNSHTVVTADYKDAITSGELQAL
ncbi:hypothetical protein [Maribacter huludaoensis]|uniref:hypothetical protein n=1 Tax=Maribacter huludaoensis TaxID=3030010 RepID=UPI0023EE1899|nr:hypothetical protein [Maribacter huludaoensis]MDF4221860.1 hypothetical protein [Maribacter huludaoensis]